MIRSSLAYIVVSSSRRKNQDDDDDEEELDLRLRKLPIEEEESLSSINLSRHESSSSIQLNRQESTTESESSAGSASSLSPGTHQVTATFSVKFQRTRRRGGSGKLINATSQGLQLNMSAREMRDRLNQQRR